MVCEKKVTVKAHRRCKPEKNPRKVASKSKSTSKSTPKSKPKSKPKSTNTSTSKSKLTPEERAAAKRKKKEDEVISTGGKKSVADDAFRRDVMGPSGAYDEGTGKYYQSTYAKDVIDRLIEEHGATDPHPHTWKDTVNRWAPPNAGPATKVRKATTTNAFSPASSSGLVTTLIPRKKKKS